TSRCAALAQSCSRYRLAPRRKMVSAPYRSIQCGTRAASIPPAGTGKAGATGPSGRRSRSLIAPQVASEKVNRPPTFGSITAQRHAIPEGGGGLIDETVVVLDEIDAGEGEPMGALRELGSRQAERLQCHAQQGPIAHARKVAEPGDPKGRPA